MAIVLNAFEMNALKRVKTCGVQTWKIILVTRCPCPSATRQILVENIWQWRHQGLVSVLVFPAEGFRCFNVAEDLKLSGLCSARKLAFPTLLRMKRVMGLAALSVFRGVVTHWPWNIMIPFTLAMMMAWTRHAKREFKCFVWLEACGNVSPGKWKANCWTCRLKEAQSLCETKVARGRLSSCEWTIPPNNRTVPLSCSA